MLSLSSMYVLCILIDRSYFATESEPTWIIQNQLTFSKLKVIWMIKLISMG